MNLILTLFSFSKGKRLNKLRLIMLLQVITCMIFTVNVKAVLTDYTNAQPEITITGKVTDESGALMPGVNIVEKGTSKGVVSDAAGGYSITVSSPGSVLVFSFV